MLVLGALLMLTISADVVEFVPPAHGAIIGNNSLQLHQPHAVEGARSAHRISFDSATTDVARVKVIEHDIEVGADADANASSYPRISGADCEGSCTCSGVKRFLLCMRDNSLPTDMLQKCQETASRCSLDLSITCTESSARLRWTCSVKGPISPHGPDDYCDGFTFLDICLSPLVLLMLCGGGCLIASGLCDLVKGAAARSEPARETQMTRRY